MEIETALRDQFADRAAAMDVPDDPYVSFARREARHRRTRRVRLGVLAAVVAALAGLQAGVIPMPGWAPGIAIASSNDALINTPARGSLAGDGAWLERMRREIKDLQDPNELWRVTDRSKIKFLYAGDVGDWRLVLAYVPVRFGFVTDPQLVWYAGPAGAAPEAMEESGNRDAGEQAATYAVSRDDEPGFALVVGPRGSTASISDGYEFTADGRVRFNPPVVGEPGTGTAQMILPPTSLVPGVTMALEWNGRTIDLGGAGGWTRTIPGDEEYDAVITRALGKREFDREMLRAWVRAGLDQARMPLAGTVLTVRWTGEVNGQPAALFTVREPGHGVVAFAMHGTAGGWRDDLRLLLPVAGADRRPIAWRLRAEGGDGRTDQVVVTAPARAATVRLTPAGGSPIDVELDRSGMGTATLAPDAAATVTSYAADGSVIASTPVPAFDDGGGVIGEKPATRVVP